jgi:hypothetical protein
MLNEPQLERFMKEFHVDPIGGCWVWDGRTSSMGFAVFDLGGGLLSYALEVALTEWCGVPIPPKSMPFDRSYRICRARLCVCPDADHAPQAARRALQREARRARAQVLLQ